MSDGHNCKKIIYTKITSNSPKNKKPISPKGEIKNNTIIIHDENECNIYDTGFMDHHLIGADVLFNDLIIYNE